MARRSAPYLLTLGSDQETELSLSEWDDLLSGGWIERTGYKTARPRRGVVAWIRGGDLWMAPIVRMPCVTASWFLIWLFQVSVSSAEQSAEVRRAQQEWSLRERERETQNEALIWCSRRGKRGANEFRWMTPAQKAEVMRALRPEPVAEAA
jgi:hypothetical protein